MAPLRMLLLAAFAAGIFAASPANAQSDAAYRVNELEEQVRRLNGRVEELTFQLLELQEQMRRMQQDNELRFQELEERSGSLTTPSDNENGAVAETDSLEKPEPSGSPDPGGQQLSASTIKPENSENAAPRTAPGPRILGTLTFDDNGNVVDVDPGKDENTTASLPGVFNDGVQGGAAAAEFGATPQEVFAAGKTALESRNAIRAEAAFRAYLQAWPGDPRTGEARYHLGRALFDQRQYYNAANVFLDTHNAHADAPTAAENLLGLGLSLAGLNQREVACATYAEVLKQYPQAAERLSAQVAAEQASAKC